MKFTRLLLPPFLAALLAFALAWPARAAGVITVVVTSTTSTAVDAGGGLCTVDTWVTFQALSDGSPAGGLSYLLSDGLNGSPVGDSGGTTDGSGFISYHATYNNSPCSGTYYFTLSEFDGIDIVDVLVVDAAAYPAPTPTPAPTPAPTATPELFPTSAAPLPSWITPAVAIPIPTAVYTVSFTDRFWDLDGWQMSFDTGLTVFTLPFVMDFLEIAGYLALVVIGIRFVASLIGARTRAQSGATAAVEAEVQAGGLDVTDKELKGMISQEADRRYKEDRERHGRANLERANQRALNALRGGRNK